MEIHLETMSLMPYGGTGFDREDFLERDSRVGLDVDGLGSQVGQRAGFGGFDAVKQASVCCDPRSIVPLVDGAPGFCHFPVIS